MRIFIETANAPIFGIDADGCAEGLGFWAHYFGMRLEALGLRVEGWELRVEG